MVDADFGVVNWLIDQIPGVDFAKHSWFADADPGLGRHHRAGRLGRLPFLAITLYAGLSQVPRELTEAATVDGANAWHVFRAVTLPILRPLLGIVTTLSVIWNFQVFTQVWVLRYGKPELRVPDAGHVRLHPGLPERQVRARLGRLDRHGAADARRDGVLHPADVQDRRCRLMATIELRQSLQQQDGLRGRAASAVRRPSQPGRHHGRQLGRARSSPS